jgi:hypothetical protein
VPSVCRRIAALLAVACLGVAAPVTPALAQGAGDQQYQDPFGNSGSGSSGSGSGSSKPKTQTNQSGSDIAPLSPAPQTAGGSSSGSSGTAGSAGSGTTTAPSPAATGSLPNTGLDARVLLLGGVALLLFGLGLRLRSAPERF